jgi:hypothetical protein
MRHWAWKEDGGIRGWGDGGKEELPSPSSGHLPISLILVTGSGFLRFRQYNC